VLVTPSVVYSVESAPCLLSRRLFSHRIHVEYANVAAMTNEHMDKLVLKLVM